MASLLSYALTSVADVKETMGIASSDTSWDNLITRKINQATEMIEGWCNRRFAATNYTDELYDATWTQQLILRQRPVITFTSLAGRDTTLNEGSFDTVDASEYFIDEEAGLVNAVSSFWGRYEQWQVTYRAGYETIPSDLAEACATLAAYLAGSDPSSTTNIRRKKEGARELEYGQNNFASMDEMFTQLGILTTLHRYGAPEV